MKIIKTLHKLSFIGWLVLMISCTDFVEVELPPSQLTGQAVFKDRATATAALSNIYAALRDQTLITGNSSGMGNILGHYSDELDYYGSSIGYIQDFNAHTVMATNKQLEILWNNAYNLIYACNSILEGVADNSALSINDRKQLQGETLFLRSFIFFYLNQLFGEIPYVTETEYEENAVIVKMGSIEIQDHLIADLEEAINLLPEDYIVPDRVRVNQFAAMAFLARVHLYAGNWEAAISTSNAVLERADLYVLEGSLDQVFKKESKGTLWQLKPVSEGGNTLEALNFIFETGPPTIGAISKSLIESFTENDQRGTHWLRSVTDGNTVWYHPYKYKAEGLTGSSVEYSVVLRLGELYLIRAEALMELGDLVGSMADLNKIRSRAGLPKLKESDRTNLEGIILQERRHEFFTEFGHRWFDLRRFQKAAEVLEPIKPNWQESDLIFPIPQSELLANPNLKPQNDGY